jgi:putative protein-disulfide isomerase
MGGLLPSWRNFNSGGIAKPSDVAHHWDEVSLYYQMPIDGDIWLEDPLDSSYPPSIAFIAAKMQYHMKAEKFLRRIKEMVFLEKKNIAKWEHLYQAALETGLDIAKFKQEFEEIIQNLHPDARKVLSGNSAEDIFSHYPTLTTKEFSVVTNQTMDASQVILQELADQNIVKKVSGRNGAIWQRN